MSDERLARLRGLNMECPEKIAEILREHGFCGMRGGWWIHEQFQGYRFRWYRAINAMLQLAEQGNVMSGIERCPDTRDMLEEPALVTDAGSMRLTYQPGAVDVTGASIAGVAPARGRGPGGRFVSNGTPPKRKRKPKPKTKTKPKAKKEKSK